VLGVVVAIVVAVLATPLSRGAGQLAGTVASAVRSLGDKPGLEPTAPVQATTFDGTPAVGALFAATPGGGLGSHFCTASVVDSPHGDLVLTAAHCVNSATAGHAVFVPGYHDGKAPYGVWPVTRALTDQNWAASASPGDDFAFLVVGQPGKAPIETVTGAERLGLGGQTAGEMVRVDGYPGAAGAPITCQNRIRLFSTSQLQFDCGGYTAGTSGSPLLAGVNPATGLGTVIGVIGGYEQGGYTPEVSYAARFGAGTAALYKAAGAF
jgi:V8-like Glu-specific endopeptidase